MSEDLLRHFIDVVPIDLEILLNGYKAALKQVCTPCNTIEELYALLKPFTTITETLHTIQNPVDIKNHPNLSVIYADHINRSSIFIRRISSYSQCTFPVILSTGVTYSIIYNAIGNGMGREKSTELILSTPDFSLNLCLWKTLPALGNDEIRPALTYQRTITYGSIDFYLPSDFDIISGAVQQIGLTIGQSGIIHSLEQKS